LKWQQCPLDLGIERALLVAELDKMASKKLAEPSPESNARANRQRLAAEEGARAMADVEQKAIAVRKNMERLRALRQAKEAEEAKTEANLPSAKTQRKKGLTK
jgi:hypothetical protein